MSKEENFAWAVEQLREMHRSLGRLPKKDDFDDKTRSRIKAYLGPWPRALEAAGIKEISQSRKLKMNAIIGENSGGVNNENL